jgi:hypothetical protein
MWIKMVGITSDVMKYTCIYSSKELWVYDFTEVTSVLQ